MQTLVPVSPGSKPQCNRHHNPLPDIRGVLVNSHARGSARLVLAILATFADKKHIAWPSVATIAHMANLSTRQVQLDLRKLVNELKELEVASPGGGRNRPTKYLITLQTYSPFQFSEKVKSLKGVSKEKRLTCSTGQKVNPSSPEGLHSARAKPWTV
jgi:hypothetical protein